MRKQAELSGMVSDNGRKWNISQAIGQYLRCKLFVDISIFDREVLISKNLSVDGNGDGSVGRGDIHHLQFSNDEARDVVFWGGGLGEPDPLSREDVDNRTILAVRGPLSSSELRLGADIPIGEPGFFLPALHEPSARPRFSNKTICIPAVHDGRSDLDLAEVSGCDLILRSEIEPGIVHFERFIDALTSAEFVLCGTVHAAIIAMTYGIPFGYWTSGKVDNPFEWADLSALVKIPCIFHGDLASAKRHYEDEVCRQISTPSMWSLIGSAPLPIRSSALLKIFWRDFRNESDRGVHFIDQVLAEIALQDQYLNRFICRYRGKANDLMSSLLREREDVERRLAGIAVDNERVEAGISRLKTELEPSLANSDEKQRPMSEESEQKLSSDGRSDAPVDALERLSEANRDLELLRCDMVRTQAELDGAVRQVGRIARRLQKNKWARRLSRLPFIAKHDRSLRNRIALIEAFLARFSEAQLGLSAEGRGDRIIAYLLGVTSQIADIPLLDRNIYRALHPDVAEAGVDPIIHYLENGHREGRTPHPLLDHEYYTRNYPETSRFDRSIIEHYIRFGTQKGYNPCAMFDTRYYLDLYLDVKSSGYNPVVHYLRNPDCQPHPHFDSHFYRMDNLDIARSGFNPLVHYLMHGRGEGRRPTRDHARAFALQNTLLNSQSIAMPNSRPASQAEKQIVTAYSEPEASRPLVIMIDGFYPRPDQDSGSLDQVNFARIFAALGYDVSFAASIDFTASVETRAPLESIGVHCITSEHYISIEEFLVLNRDRISTFFLSRFNFGGTWIERARSFCPRARVILNTVDLHHLREERQGRITKDAAISANAEKTKKGELAAIAAADVTVVVSKAERDILDELLPAADVRVIPLVRQVHERVLPSFGKRSGIAFVGGFEHVPNVDAIIYFIEEIWPKILAIDPSITLCVIGSNMPASLSRRTDRNVEWVGFVRELEPWLDKVRLTVAPLRFGAGAKGKIVSSLLNGIPCIATPIAAEGMGLEADDGVLTADGPDEFAKLVVSLHHDEVRWAESSERGLAAIRRSYSLDRGIELVEQILPRLRTKEEERL